MLSFPHIKLHEVGTSGKIVLHYSIEKSPRWICKVCEANPLKIRKSASIVRDFLLRGIIHFIFSYFGLGPIWVYDYINCSRGLQISATWLAWLNWGYFSSIFRSFGFALSSFNPVQLTAFEDLYHDNSWATDSLHKHSDIKHNLLNW